MGNPTLPPASPLIYAGTSAGLNRQITLANADAAAIETTADSSSSSPAGESSPINTTGASGAAAAKATKGDGKELQKQPRTNPNAVPLLFTPINAQLTPQPLQAPGAGTDSDTSKDGESSSHGAETGTLAAAAQPAPLMATPVVEENSAAKTVEAGKASASEDQSSVPEDLTFAARVQAGNAPKASADLPRVPTVRHGASETDKDQTSDTPTPAVSPQTAAAVAQRFDVGASRAESNNAADPSALQATSQPSAVTQSLQNDEVATAKTPLKDISFQVGPAQGQKVEVRVTEQAGELRVAVRTGDTDVAQGLRQGLSDLTTKLSENGYRAETWRPGDLSGLTSSSAKETSDNPGQSSHGGSQSQSQSQSGSPQQERGQQNQNPSNRPRWVQELETTLRSGAGSTGDFNGLIS